MLPILQNKQFFSLNPLFKQTRTTTTTPSATQHPVHGKERAGTRCCPQDSALAALEQGSSGVSLQAPLSCCCHVTAARCLLEAQHRKTLKCSQVSPESVFRLPGQRVTSRQQDPAVPLWTATCCSRGVVLLPEGPENSTLLQRNLC